MLTLGIEGGPRDGQEITVPIVAHGRPAGTIVLDDATYVLRMFGAEPHEGADWHYCHLNPQP